MNRQIRFDGLESFEHKDLTSAITAIKVLLSEIEEREHDGRDITKAAKKRDIEIDAFVELVDEFNQRPRPTKDQDITKPVVDDEVRHIIRELYTLIETLDMQSEEARAQINLKGQELDAYYKKKVWEANTEDQPIWRPDAMYYEQAVVSYARQDISPPPDFEDVMPAEDKSGREENENEVDQDSEVDLEWPHKLQPDAGGDGYVEALVTLVTQGDKTAPPTFMVDEVEDEEEYEESDEDLDEHEDERAAGSIGKLDSEVGGEEDEDDDDDDEDDEEFYVPGNFVKAESE